jgi:hypothetical protein
MAAAVAAWPRPYFKPGDLRTSVFFVCFGKAPLSDLPLDSARFGLPDAGLARQVDLREHRRATSRQWFEDWWAGPFGVMAEQDLGDDLALLTTSDACYTLKLDLPDHPDLAPIQTAWAMARWLCARGAAVVLDVHAFRYRSAADLDRLDFAAADAQREVKLVLETDATRDGLHLMHTRGLCKFARPELSCFVQPDDASLMGRVLNQLGRTVMEGALASQLRLRLADGLELVTRPVEDQGLVDSLGLESAVSLVRADGASLGGIARLVPGA